MRNAGRADELCMTIRGDTQSFDLGDLLQSFETHGKSGILTLVLENEEVRVLFAAGKIAACAARHRPPLPETLVACGRIDERTLVSAVKKRGRGRRPICEILVGCRAITVEDLKEAAETLLFESVADVVAAGCATFAFAEGEDPKEAFDPEELGLRLAISVGPLLLEAARRKDHWALVRKVIPSDTAHFVARPGVRCPEDIEDKELAASLLETLDGTRSVTEVAAMFLHVRFQCYLLLERLVRDRLVRAAVADDLAAIARRMLPRDPGRARRVIRHGLESEPHHQDLLQLEARLAEQAEDGAGAAQALKMLAHLQAEAGMNPEAERLLTQACRLAPSDPAVSERMLALLLDQGKRDQAINEGKRLADLYRAPGLHAKAKEVLSRLVDLEPGAIDLRLALAREQVDCGESQEAVRSLLRQGKHLITKESYAAARTVFGEVLAIDAVNKEAKWSIEMLDKETFARRRERRRRLQRRSIAGLLIVLLVVGAVFETRAHADLLETNGKVAEEEWIEQRRYADALQAYEELTHRHPMTLTAWFDVRLRIKELEAKLDKLARPPR
jgi:tetratricopeptide (TPR) repeat protein